MSESCLWLPQAEKEEEEWPEGERAIQLFNEHTSRKSTATMRRRSTNLNDSSDSMDEILKEERKSLAVSTRKRLSGFTQSFGSALPSTIRKRRRGAGSSMQSSVKTVLNFSNEVVAPDLLHAEPSVSQEIQHSLQESTIVQPLVDCEVVASQDQSARRTERVYVSSRYLKSVNYQNSNKDHTESNLKRPSSSSFPTKMKKAKVAVDGQDSQEAQRAKHICASCTYIYHTRLQERLHAKSCTNLPSVSNHSPYTGVKRKTRDFEHHIRTFSMHESAAAPQVSSSKTGNPNHVERGTPRRTLRANVAEQKTPRSLSKMR